MTILNAKDNGAVRFLLKTIIKAHHNTDIEKVTDLILMDDDIRMDFVIFYRCSYIRTEYPRKVVIPIYTIVNQIKEYAYNNNVQIFSSFNSASSNIGTISITKNNEYEAVFALFEEIFNENGEKNIKYFN